MKSSKNSVQQLNVDLMNFAARFIQRPSNKAKIIRRVVYTANVALIVGKIFLHFALSLLHWLH